MMVSGAEISVDDVLAVLSHSNRRELLASLIADSPPDEATFSVIDVDGADSAMHHLHLPKMADYGLIVWEKDADTITKGPNFEMTESVLDSLAEHDADLLADEVAL
ncbi:hypothetical protein [Halobacterium sp. R2-5]|uniref:hypothetical protein n=1 Tax=Halobacterium sp. R2-5 TaxID=2715751 RepID=UPI00141EE58E|nr:hypothetical protein [Halobacterium sp. R2-5]NIC00982.1 hypothetical protein [Halobacterium sp. R2-5]